jgi:hypothetical protein
MMGAIKFQKHETINRSSSAPEPAQDIPWTEAMIKELRRNIPENQCPICLGSAFHNKQYCTRHINTVHLKRLPHRCAACGTCFGVRQQVYRHLDRRLNRNCKAFYQDFLKQSNIAEHLKRNLHQMESRLLEKLYSNQSRAKIIWVNEGIETPENLAAQALLSLAASGAE